MGVTLQKTVQKWQKGVKTANKRGHIIDLASISIAINNQFKAGN